MTVKTENLFGADGQVVGRRDRLHRGPVWREADARGNRGATTHHVRRRTPTAQLMTVAVFFVQVNPRISCRRVGIVEAFLPNHRHLADVDDTTLRRASEVCSGAAGIGGSCPIEAVSGMSSKRFFLTRECVRIVVGCGSPTVKNLGIDRPGGKAADRWSPTALQLEKACAEMLRGATFVPSRPIR